MNYLVTGAAGFIGSKIAERLIKEGHSVVTIDNLSTGYEECVPAGCEFICGNDYDEAVIDKLQERKFDAIIHIAGQSSGEISFEDPKYDLNTNTLSTLMLLQYAKRTGCKNFIYASSMSVYGEHGEIKVGEDAWPTPKSFYAVGKLASENYMRIFANSFGIKCTALRFFNVYGPGQNLANLKQGMVSIYLALAIKNHHITVKGAGDRFRDFVYIDDIVDSVLLSLDRKGEAFEYINVANGRKITVSEICDLISNSLPYDVSVEYVAGTPGDQHGIFGDNSKAKELLGWEPKVIFEEGMKTMIDWAVKQ